MSHGDISAPIKVAANKFLPRPFDEPHSCERYSGAFNGFRIGGSQILLSNTPPTPGGENPQFSPPFFIGDSFKREKRRDGHGLFAFDNHSTSCSPREKRRDDFFSAAKLLISMTFVRETFAARRLPNFLVDDSVAGCVGVEPNGKPHP